MFATDVINLQYSFTLSTINIHKQLQVECRTGRRRLPAFDLGFAISPAPTSSKVAEFGPKYLFGIAGPRRLDLIWYELPCSTSSGLVSSLVHSETRQRDIVGLEK
ncbi:hypothetical protein AX15_004536 [Amanita polypyramis BW_CC]|nr:hypothetical protein AX15_004536 [Amanita polypyramis BW_CC]